VTERIARKGLYIPSGLAITNEQMDHVCAAVRKILS
jgi:perosamine synthetase